MPNLQVSYPIGQVISPFGDLVQMGNLTFRRRMKTYTLQLARNNTIDAPFTGKITIQPNVAPFLLLSLHASDTADGNALTSQEDWLVTAQDNDGGFLWSDGPVGRSCMFGGREFGYILPDTMAMMSQSVITWTIYNKHAGPTAGTATIELRGWHLWPAQ